MKKTTYQIPEIRDENDNIIQSGTYGKNSPLCNATNDGVLDYINNNLEYLKSTQSSIQKYLESTQGYIPSTPGSIQSDYFLKSGGKITGNTEIEVKTSGQYNSPLTIQVPDLNDGEGVYLNLGKEGTTNNRFSFGFEYAGNGSSSNSFSVSAFSGAHYTFDAVGNATIPKSLTSPAVTAGAITVNGTGLTTTSLTASGETSVPTANSGNKSKTIANTEFVQNTIASLVDSAPETLNTLNELATALNNDPNFATTITNMIAEKESKTDANVEYETLRQAIAAKRDNLTFDTTPTAGSTNPVTSDGIKKAIDTKQNNLTFDTTPTAGSVNPVTSNGVYEAIHSHQGELTYDSVPTANSTNLVNSGNIKTALDLKQDNLTFDATPTAGSTNPVTSDGIKAAIDAKTVFNSDGHLVFPNGAEMWVE